MKLFLKTIVVASVMALFAACGSSNFEWFPDTDTTVNTAPVANAGPDQTIAVGTEVTLNGSGTDADSDTLTFSWAFTSKPEGSTASFSSTTAANPTFTADVTGTYIVSLIVNDGRVNSAADSVTVTVTSSLMANAGTAQNVIVNDSVTLDGSGSRGANAADALTYNWAISSKPSESAAQLSSVTVVSPTFTADKTGIYVLTLTVNDGKADSSPATVTITAFDTPPVANAGADKDAFTGTTITLDGSASIGANLSYNWRFADKPIGSGDVSLSSATVVRPTFTTNIPGTYVIELIVKDRLNSSLPNTVTVTVSNLGSITVTW